MLQKVAADKKIIEQAVEKDWWVCATLKALSESSLSDFLQFKGGTSLSKSFGIIDRFSEDIDLALNRSFFGLPKKTEQQRAKIRRQTFHYVKDFLIAELHENFNSKGITDFEIKLVSKNSSAMVTILEIEYKSILETMIEYVKPVVKIEISSMSMEEPFVEKELNTFVNQFYSEIDVDLRCKFKTVVPERTFLEKIFLLHEEYQKEKPRVARMSRHLYDIEKIMQTPFAKNALADKNLYRQTVQHRKSFNNIQGIDYESHNPQTIKIVPPECLHEQWAKDYEQLQKTFIYGKSLPFDELLSKIAELQNEMNHSF